jgi:hypothetical protein
MCVFEQKKKYDGNFFPQTGDVTVHVFFVSKSTLIVTLWSKCTRALTFQNFFY